MELKLPEHNYLLFHQVRPLFAAVTPHTTLPTSHNEKSVYVAAHQNTSLIVRVLFPVTTGSREVHAFFGVYIFVRLKYFYLLFGISDT